jgi:hypothetical protein
VNALDRLQSLLNRALEKVKSEQLRSIAEAVRLMLPEVLVAIQDVAVDPTSTPAQRLRAGEMLLDIWEKVLRADLQESRTTAIRDQARAKYAAATAAKIQARAEEKASLLKIAAKRRRMQRVLDKAAKQMETSTT